MGGSNDSEKWHGVSLKMTMGESGVVNKVTMDTRQKHWLVKALERSTNKDNYDLNEAAFFYKLLPKRIYATAGSPSSGGKQIKECMTVLFATYDILVAKTSFPTNIRQG